VSPSSKPGGRWAARSSRLHLATCSGIIILERPGIQIGVRVARASKVISMRFLLLASPLYRDRI
jgi:hypothetical protein